MRESPLDLYQTSKSSAAPPLTLPNFRTGSMATPPHDPWTLRESDYPARGSREEQLRFLLRYAILAPSNRNTQPWQFAVGRDQVTIHSDSSR